LREPIEHLQFVGNGHWRSFAYPDESQWPAVASRFERPKYLYRTSRGNGLLWKFVGLGAFIEPDRTAAELDLDRINVLARGGWGPPALEVFGGYAGIRWINGDRLQPTDAAQPDVLSRLARYLAPTAGWPLTPAEQGAALERLIAITTHNLQEALGDKAAARARTLALAVRLAADCPSFADGRLAPHEWVHCTSGEIFKSDSAGHQIEHTAVGRQAVLWDVADALVEWRLIGPQRLALLNELRREGIFARPEQIAFYELAYAAFRLGQTTLCLELEAGNSPERQRLTTARQIYSTQAAGILERSDGNGSR